MRFQKYLYRFEAGEDTVWGLEPGYVYTIKSIHMSGANVSTKDSTGFMLYLKNSENEYMQYELGLIPLMACTNDRSLPDLDIQLAYDYDPYLGSLNGTLPTRAILVIEYERREQATGKTDVGLPGNVI